MKLIYRGTTYDYNPSQTPSRAFEPVSHSQAYNLMYRGISYRVDPNAKSANVPTTPVTYNLIYRGISYLVNKTPQTEVSVVSQPINTAKVYFPKPSFLKLFNRSLAKVR